MNKIKMLNLIPFFDSIDSERYCVVKLSEGFPTYSPGDDIDIFCYEPDRIAKKILEWANQHIKKDLEIKVISQAEYNHVTIDFMDGRAIHLRFDIYGQLPLYKKVLIKPALFENIIDHSQPVCKKIDNINFCVNIPDLIDDMLLRYIEFIEWYNIRPDKIKHLDYIMDKIDDEKKIRFLNKLHHYTAIPVYQDLQDSKLKPPKRGLSFLKILKRYRADRKQVHKG